MMLLLNAMGIHEKLTVISNSYGGLIALLLAGMDKRIEKVILVGSSPTLNNASFFLRLLGKTGLLKIILKTIIRIYTGRTSQAHIDQDEFYELRTTNELKNMAIKVLKHTGRNELASMYFRIDSLLDRHNNSAPVDLKLNIPVIQIIGDKDEFWGTDIPEIYRNNFPLLKQSIIKAASHTDLILKADVFYQELVKLLNEQGNTASL
jgi:pimeloyl-ACP methyl ester carboxylesterase